MKCVVVGLGQFGRTAALKLARSGVEVIAIDENMELVDSVKDEVALAVRVDASREEALELHGAAEAEVLIAAIGRNFEAQLLVVVYAKKLGIPKVIARAATPEHARILQLVGADQVVNPEENAADRLVQALLIPNIQGYFSLVEGFSVVETGAPRALYGKTLRELNLRRQFKINVIAIKRHRPGTEAAQAREEFNPVPLPEERIEEGDVLALVGSDLDLARFMAEYTGR